MLTPLEPDLAQLVMEQLRNVEDAFSAAAVCMAWRNASRDVWGTARLLGEVSRLVKLCPDSLDLVQPDHLIVLPDGNICVVDSYVCDPHRRVMIVTPDFEPVKALPCAARPIYPESEWCPGEGHLEAAAASGDALFVTYYVPGCPGNAGEMFKYSLADDMLLHSIDSSYPVSGWGAWEAASEEESEDMEWDQYFCHATDLVILGERLYVCDRGGECGDPSVVVFDHDLRYLFTFGTGNDNDSSGSGTDDSGSDTDDWRTIGTPNDSRGQLTDPLAIAAHEGLLYLLECRAKRVSVFDASGQFQHVVLCNGEHFANPPIIAFARGRLLVGCKGPQQAGAYTSITLTVPCMWCAHGASKRCH